ncbi:MAG: hypothetical protein WB676_03050 [Bryobacteraceae bacterium]
MRIQFRWALAVQFTFASLFLTSGIAKTAPLHPLDSLTTAEYWTVYDVLQKNGHAGPDDLFASVLLREPPKSAVLAWKPGNAVPREADVVILHKGQTFEAQVDITSRKLVSWNERKDVQAPFVPSEIFGTDEVIKKDPRIVEVLKKRGISDMNTVECLTLPVSYASVPEQLTQRIGFGSCSEQHGSYHSWGRSIEGSHFEWTWSARRSCLYRIQPSCRCPLARLTTKRFLRTPGAVQRPFLSHSRRAQPFKLKMAR